MYNLAIFEANKKKYYFADIVRSLKKVGIKKGDNIFVHSDLGQFGKLVEIKNKEEYIDLFINALRKVIGNEGTLIVPTFSYSFTKGEIYDPKTTPSTIGILTEHFRKKDGVLRSLDAIFSVAAIGPKAKYFTEVGFECFGKKSIFSKLYKKNVKLVFLGNKFSITYMYYVEKKFKVKYRFDKDFKGKIRVGDALKDYVFIYFVRYLDKNIEYDLMKIKKLLKNENVLKETKLGNSSVCMVFAQDAFMKIFSGLKKDEYFLLKEPPSL